MTQLDELTMNKILLAQDEHVEEVTTDDHSAPNETQTLETESHAKEDAHTEEAAHAAGEAHAGPHISIKAEPIYHIGNFQITNSVLTSWIVTAIFIAMAVYYASQMKKETKSKFFYAIHGLVQVVYGLFHSVLGHHTPTFFSLLGTFFFFILLNNWFGLIPGVGSLLVPVMEHGEKVMVPLLRGGTADLNTTLALALVSVVMTQVYGFKMIGFKAHMSKYFNFKGPVEFAVGFFEIISEFSRILSFSFRLFGNILAGEVLLAILAFILPSLIIAITSPMYLLEIFVGFIQAFVFSILTAIFISMAVTEHH